VPGKTNFQWLKYVIVSMAISEANLVQKQ
jgi:hypothetical protein